MIRPIRVPSDVRTQIRQDAERWRIDRQKTLQEAETLERLACLIHGRMHEALRESPPSPLARSIARGERITVRVRRNPVDVDLLPEEPAGGAACQDSEDRWTLDLRRGCVHPILFFCDKLRSGTLTSHLHHDRMRILLAPNPSLLVRNYQETLDRIDADLKDASLRLKHDEALKQVFTLFIQDMFWIVRSREVAEWKSDHPCAPWIAQCPHLIIRVKKEPWGWIPSKVLTPEESRLQPPWPDDVELILQGELRKAEEEGLRLVHRCRKAGQDGSPTRMDAEFREAFRLDGDTVIVLNGLIKKIY